MEFDAIGEILNISLGASATAVSSMLEARVDITTPSVRVVRKEDFTFSNLKPAIGVEISYIEGLSGKNVMLLKRNDVKVIVEMLMGVTYSDEEFELNEMNISAISEVMNQMMGASSTALSELLGRTVNISTPQSFEVDGEDVFKEKYFTEEDPMVVIGFSLSIEGKMESEFLNLMTIDLAKELVTGFFTDGLPDVEEEPEKDAEQPVSQAAAPAEAAQQSNVSAAPGEAAVPVESPAPQMAGTPAQTVSAAGMVQPNMAEQMQSVQGAAPVQGADIPAAGSSQLLEQMVKTMQVMQQQMLQMQNSQTERRIQAKKAPSPALRAEESAEDTDVNLDLLMDVPLELSVEIGRSKKLVKDILDLNKGSLVVLDRAAGEAVDLYVNGECIAKGDVVVVDDNFGIRITEILGEDTLLEE